MSELGERLEPVGPLLVGHPLCVCATGSYGRLEAWKKSDADVFFLYDDADETQRLPVTSFIRFASLLIDAAEEMQFPPFSGDGRYLEVQYVGEMENVLGEEFLPTVLLNDILRFWRTLTLNYEHHRLKLKELVGDALERKKADSALKNYKLKVSRLATCFSMVASLSSEPVPVTPERVLELCRITPAKRFGRCRRENHRPPVTFHAPKSSD